MVITHPARSIEGVDYIGVLTRQKVPQHFQKSKNRKNIFSNDLDSVVKEVGCVSALTRQKVPQRFQKSKKEQEKYLQ